MPRYPNEIVSPTSLVLLQPLLAALDAADTAVLKSTSSLPAPCFCCADTRAIICATTINTLPIFRAAMVTVAAINQVDVLFVQHGFFPEELDDVTLDVVTGRNRSVTMLYALCRYRGRDGSTWLVPSSGGAGPSALVEADGLTVTAELPYADPGEGGDGLSRAARETVRAMRVLRRS